MSRLREVALHGEMVDDLRVSHRRLVGVCRALEVGLSIEKIEGPFMKLVVALHATYAHERFGFEDERIGFAYLRDDLRRYDLGTATQAEVRARARELLLRGMDVIRDFLGWDSEPFRAIIEKVTTRTGPWQANFRDAPFEKATRTRYHTVLVWDEDSFAVRLEQRDRAGTVLRSWPVTTDEIGFMWVTKTRLVDGRIEYVDSLGHVATAVEVGAPS